ncbi:MAG: hypothetical protein RMM98_15195 [Acidobacteriota bacterium]|nr:hypothetical protein [Blastocatellia bacterium]MDW8240948.1 hypothetical protein [Acidobacteriota bacterium]
MKHTNRALLLCLMLLVSPSGVAPANQKDKKLTELKIQAAAAYGGLGTLLVLRQSGFMRGTVKLYTGTDTPQEGEITIRFTRKLKVAEDLTRIDLKLPSAPKLTIAWDGTRVWGTEDDRPIVLYLRSEAAMKAQLIHNYEAFLRAEELGTPVKYIGEEKRSGIPLHVLELRHADGSTTRYYVSAKTWRILHLEYEFSVPSQAKPIRVRESFYDFRVVQNTLAPFQVKRYEDDQLVQEYNFTEVTFGVQIDKSLFEQGGGSTTKGS